MRSKRSDLGYHLDSLEINLDNLERTLKMGDCCIKASPTAKSCAYGAVVDYYLVGGAEGKVQATVERRGGRISKSDSSRRTSLMQRAERVRARFEAECVCKSKKGAR